MKFFKYLVFIIISLFSVQAFAATWQGTLAGKAFTGSSAESVCSQGQSFIASGNPSVAGLSHVLLKIDDKRYTCRITTTTAGYQPWEFVVFTNDTVPPVTCPQQGYPVPTYFEPNTPIPLRACKQNPDGTYCIYEASDKVNPLVISTGKYQMITLSSISSIPSPSCTPEFSKSTCNPKDPYGGCYQPPDDGCNRLADGSIYCPEGTPPPPIKTGCQNGATYCDMPPTGCGSGYVPGSFNGKQICVKNSNPPPTDPIPQPPEPDPTDPPDPNDPPPASSPPPAIPPESSTILRSILDAINAVNNKLTWVKDEIVNSVNNVSRTLGITNQKLDAVNSSVKETTAAVKETTAAVNNVKAAVDANATTVKTAVEANADKVKGAVDANTNSTANKLNEVVNAINNKPVGGGGGGTTDVKPVVDAIEKQTTDFKDMMKTDSSDFDTSQYEKIGDASDDPRYLNAQSEATNALQNLSNKLTFSNTACVQDFTVDFPYFGSFVVPISRWCELLALIKILIHLSTLILAFRMLDSTVRAI
ncbi:TPA: methyl-accepting chemotaxis protein [Acinetobacter baumannii]|uniref:methyl-accepting chemotaxis protein n=1 Tax=Acinetobacter baumannii TaxID=470 RepID=UPI00297125AF|nr:methyl-accepting chemotaxis protein [Acinetobacter baumannii]HAV6238442.1 methyl-accepting chemotaxis protein [Acinetobacter baumannii]HAV6254866.1 methyl-accepting chemotaxis protein [Acinetobacter baumannii]